MPDFSTVEDTLFVPMLGRIYASENFPQILFDEKALSLKSRLPAVLKGQDTQTQYTLMASAVRSTNMDRYIGEFLSRYPDGIIAQLGCGLETTFFRCSCEKATWYEIDLPDVIAYRKSLLGEHPREHLIAADAFSTEWITEIRKLCPHRPVLVTASGLFYYFPCEKVKTLFKDLKAFGPVEVVFDTVNKSGMKQMSKYMKQVGHEEAAMYFYVDKGSRLANELECSLLREEPYYSHTVKKGLSFSASATMTLSDWFRMVKMIHLKLA